MKVKYTPPTLNQIILLANHLDSVGLLREASYLDALLKKSYVDSDEDKDVDSDESHEPGPMSIDDYIKSLCNMNSIYQKRLSESSAHMKLFYNGEFESGSEESERYKAMMTKSRAQTSYFRTQLFKMLDKASSKGVTEEMIRESCPNFLIKEDK